MHDKVFSASWHLTEKSRTQILSNARFSCSTQSRWLMWPLLMRGHQEAHIFFHFSLGGTKKVRLTWNCSRFFSLFSFLLFCTFLRRKLTEWFSLSGKVNKRGNFGAQHFKQKSRNREIVKYCDIVTVLQNMSSKDFSRHYIFCKYVKDKEIVYYEQKASKVSHPVCAWKATTSHSGHCVSISRMPPYLFIILLI